MKPILFILLFTTSVLAYPEVWLKIQPVQPRHNEVLKEPLSINLNSADQASLQRISGIGPKKAQAIIDFRTQNGPFKKVTDLEKIKGFSKKIVAKLVENNNNVVCSD
jgi:comEA protein